jgi:hypothetical protein
MARLTEDLRAFAETPRLLQVGGSRFYAGRGGCFLRQQNGHYILTALTEWGDTVEYTADNLYGPYGNQRLILTQSRQVGLFEAKEGEWTAVISHY